jgi:predicted DCC family thiol-disulfide oxidoreductase YuxK
MSGEGALTVLYDADCGVCRVTAAALMRLDWWRRLDLVPLQSFVAEPGPASAELLEALHVRDGAGRWARGGAAALRIASVIPVLMPLAIAGRLPGMAGVAERAYRFVAGRRHVISRLLDLDRCALDLRPDPAADVTRDA